MIIPRARYQKHNILKELYLHTKFYLILLYKILSNRKKSTSQYTPITKGVPYLTITKSGTLRCNSCMLCVQYCPAECISIKPKDNNQPPKSFELDLLKCVFCGLCVEACPIDAIRMDQPYKLAGHAEGKWILDAKALTKNIISKVEEI